MIRSMLERVRAEQTLGREEMKDLIVAIMRGEGKDSDVADLLLALHERGETLDEVVGAARAMRDLARPLPRAPENAVDTCGTGGDGANTFNISTLAALVVASCGVPVAKHGNRAATSRCGSADVLEALDVRLEIGPERMAECVTEIGIGFLFARDCHPAMARVAPIRRQLGTPTIFNRLGPLAHPMGVQQQLVGVADAALLRPTREALAALETSSAWVVHARDGLDELSTCAVSDIAIYLNGEGEERSLEAGQFFPQAQLEGLRGGDAQQNAVIARAILEGEVGARRDIVLLNAAAALCAAQRCGTLEEGIKQSSEALDSGATRDLLVRWVEYTREASA